MIYQINQPEILQIADAGGNTYYGANQNWYQQARQRWSGCGPTTCSNLMWYLSRTRENSEQLTSFPGDSREGRLKIMEEVWNYVNPGAGGVNSTRIFIDGAKSYTAAKELSLTWDVLDVPAVSGSRPDVAELMQFCQNSFVNDRPVAFLNRSNGKLTNLDNWHWVTLIAFSPEDCSAVMYNNGRRLTIELGKWLETTALGGGLVALDINPDDEVEA